MDLQIDEVSCSKELQFLERCLVGRVGDLDCPIPSRLELQRWVDRRWKSAGGVRVVIMNGKFFLFEFPLKEEASRILMQKNLVFDNNPLLLDRWNPVACCHRDGRTPKVAWIRALGLPLHLWGSKVF